MTSRTGKIYRVTAVGSVGNVLLTVFKFVAGIIGHSAAMIADAVHSLSDLITDVIVIVFVRISSQPSDSTHDYGHGKFETLATAIISLMLILVGVGIAYEGGKDIYNYCRGIELERPGYIALVAAILSIVVKEGLYRYTKREARALKSKAVEANAWHHRSDAFSSLGTALGVGGAIVLGVKGRVLDPLAAVIVSIFIIRVGIQLLKPCMDELLERSLPDDIEQQILDIINTTAGVNDPHKLRTRRIGNNVAIDVDIRMDGDMTVRQAHDTTRDIEHRLRQLLGADTIINIHVEPTK